MTRFALASAVLVLLVSIPACGGSTPAPASPSGPPVHVDAAPRIVTADEVTTEPELARRGERALIEQRWKDAADAYSKLVAADPKGPRAGEYEFDLALAYEGQQLRQKARDTYADVATRFPASASARSALVRAATLDAYLEEWKALGEIGDAILARTDIDDVDRIVALGARGLSKVELGDDMGASKDVHDGLDLSDRTHYGQRDVIPVASAQLRFALGEVRRVRSERIKFDPLPADFLAKLEERCAGLLEAQSAYAEAVRSIDPHWAAMAGYRVGEMYRVLHHDLVAIPPPPQSKTEKQKQIFFAFMHVRYRVLLEKGLRQVEQTIALGERTDDSSSWVKRAQAAKSEMEIALADEKAQIANFAFTEDEIKVALDELAKKAAQRSP